MPITPKTLSVLPGTQDDGDTPPKEYKAYGIQTRMNHALLSFHFSNGDRQSFSYSHLYRVGYHPSEGLTLTFSEHVIDIQGHNLAELPEQLNRPAVPWIWEANEQQQRLAAKDEAVVTNIHITEKYPEHS